MNKEVYTEFIYITPEIARQLLKWNTLEHQRTIRKQKVIALKEAFERGEYILTHQGIGISMEFFINGEVIRYIYDGQHRLTAISEMTHGSFLMAVTWNLPFEAYKAIDIGSKRTAAEVLREDRRLTEVARLIVTIGNTKKSSRYNVTPARLIPFVENMRKDHTELIEYCGTTSKVFSSAPVRLSAIVSARKFNNFDYAKSIYRNLLLGNYDELPTIARVFYKLGLKGAIRASNHSDMIARALCVFDPRKAHNTKIQISDVSDYLAIVRESFANVEKTQINPRNEKGKENEEANRIIERGIPLVVDDTSKQGNQHGQAGA